MPLPREDVSVPFARGRSCLVSHYTSIGAYVALTAHHGHGRESEIWDGGRMASYGSVDTKLEKNSGFMICLFVKWFMCCFYFFPLRWLAEDERDGCTVVRLYPQPLDF